MEKKTQAITVLVPLELHAAARHKSIDERKSLNKVMIEKLAEWVRQPKQIAKTTK
jgi:hypothetical protein